MRSVPLYAAFLVTVLVSVVETPAQQTPAAEIAPSGSLRVGFQMGVRSLQSEHRTAA